MQIKHFFNIFCCKVTQISINLLGGVKSEVSVFKLGTINQKCSNQ